MRENGGIIGPLNTPSIDAASGVWGLNAALRAVADGHWPVVPPLPVNLSYITTVASGTDLTTYTFASTSLGTAAEDRRIVVAIVGRSGSTRTLDAVSVAGVSATEVVTMSDNTSGTALASIWIASVPTGTTGDVVLTFSAGMLGAAAAIYRLTQAATAATDTQTTTNPTAGVTLTAPAYGASVAVTYNNNSTSGIVWTGLTEDNTQNIESGRSMSAASLSHGASAFSATVSADWTATESAPRLAAASWGPAT